MKFEKEFPVLSKKNNKQMIRSDNWSDFFFRLTKVYEKQKAAQLTAFLT